MRTPPSHALASGELEELQEYFASSIFHFSPPPPPPHSYPVHFFFLLLLLLRFFLDAAVNPATRERADGIIDLLRESLWRSSATEPRNFLECSQLLVKAQPGAQVTRLARVGPPPSPLPPIPPHHTRTHISACTSALLLQSGCANACPLCVCAYLMLLRHSRTHVGYPFLCTLWFEYNAQKFKRILSPSNNEGGGVHQSEVTPFPSFCASVLA